MKFTVSWFLAGVLLVLVQPVYAQQPIPLKGTLNVMEGKISVDLKVNQKEPIHLEASRSSKDSFHVRLAISHWQRGDFDISTVLQGSLKIVSDQGAMTYLTGRLDSQYTLINDHSFSGPSVDFMVRNKEVVIRSLAFGPFSASGKIPLAHKPGVDMTVKFTGMSLAEISALFQKGKMIEGTGLADGEIFLRGTWDRLQIRGGVRSYNGFVGLHDYNMAQFNFDGIYPIIHIDNSYISQPDGLSFDVKGMLDLSDPASFKDQMRRFVRSPLISENGNDMEWTFKRLGSDQQKGTTELKYMIKDSSSGGQTGIFGVERQIKF